MNKSVTLNPDFISDYQEGIKIMSRQEFVNYVKEMEDGQTTDLYILADKENRQTEYNIAIRKEKWNNSTYYLLGGYGYRITTINAEPEITDEDLPAEINNALDYFDIGEQLGVVIVTFPDYSARQLYRQVQDALKLGCKFLQVYRNKEEMLKAKSMLLQTVTENFCVTSLNPTLSTFKMISQLSTPLPCPKVSITRIGYLKMIMTGIKYCLNASL